MTITDARLDEIRERCEKATKHGWFTVPSEMEDWGNFVSHAQTDIADLLAELARHKAVVEAAEIVAEGTALESGTTPLRMQNLRSKLAALETKTDD